jgi:hypothetical protein
MTWLDGIVKNKTVRGAAIAAAGGAIGYLMTQLSRWESAEGASLSVALTCILINAAWQWIQPHLEQPSAIPKMPDEEEPKESDE